MEHKECNTCYRLEQATMLDHNGDCVPCEHIKASNGEIPASVVMRLLSLAKTRHPSAVEDAHRFEEVLEREGVIPSNE